jgi:hypothetical protein
MPLTATKKYDVEALGWNTLAGYLLGMGSLKTDFLRFSQQLSMLVFKR